MKAKGFKSRTEIAEWFEISRKTLYNKLKKSDLKLPSGKLNVENQKKLIEFLRDCKSEN